MDRKSKWLNFAWWSLLGIFLGSRVEAALIEISGMGSYSKSQFEMQGGTYRAIQKRYTASLDFKFTSVSSIQFEYSDAYTETSAPTNIGVVVTQYTTETVKYRDRVYSANLVQNLVPSKWILQPYIKGGGGKMYRSQEVLYPEFGQKYKVSDTITTGVAGGGVRLFLTRNMALKGEAVTYVPNFKFKKWRENQNFSAGISWLF